MSWVDSYITLPRSVDFVPQHVKGNAVVGFSSSSQQWHSALSKSYVCSYVSGSHPLTLILL